MPVPVQQTYIKHAAYTSWMTSLMQHDGASHPTSSPADTIHSLPLTFNSSAAHVRPRIQADKSLKSPQHTTASDRYLRHRRHSVVQRRHMQRALGQWPHHRRAAARFPLGPAPVSEDRRLARRAAAMQACKGECQGRCREMVDTVLYISGPFACMILRGAETYV